MPLSNTSTDPYEHDSEVIEHNPFPNPSIEIFELYARVRQLQRALTDARRAYADLVAACRAALAARADGEPDADAWAYIVDELPPAPPGHPLHHSGRDGSGPTAGVGR